MVRATKTFDGTLISDLPFTVTITDICSTASISSSLSSPQPSVT
jgi:hypothetical protein